MNDKKEATKHSELAISSGVTAGIVETRDLAKWFVDEAHWFCRVFFASTDRFYWENGFTKAASLAYSSLLSLVPLMALICGFLAISAVSGRYIPEVREFVFKQIVPNDKVAESALHYLTQYSDAISSLNVLVIGFLVVCSLLLLNSIESALNETWQVFEPRPIAHRISIFCAILIIAPVLVLSAYWFAKFRFEQFLEGIGVSEVTLQLYYVLLPFLMDLVAFVSLYFLVPKAPVKFRSALFGGVVSAILFGLARSGFAYYLAEFSTYDRIYQTLAVVPVSLVWLYLCWIVILFGAEVAFQFQHLPRKGRIWKRTILSVGDGRLLLAVQALSMIGSSFLAGERLPNELEMAERLGCSTVVLKPVLYCLEQAGIIVRGETRDGPVTLLKSMEMIGIGEIRDSLYHGAKPVLYAEQLERLFKGLGSVDGNDKMTLASVIMGEGSK